MGRTRLSIVRRSWGLLGVLVVLASGGPIRGQAGAEDIAGMPAVVQGLLGSWEGSGELLSRAGTFHMRWEAGDGGFVHLAFDNGWVDAEGVVTPVLSARALYRFTGAVGTGVWLDDRPQQLRIELAVTDSSLVADWTAAAEEGRTEYVVGAGESLRVRDWVYANGEARLFGEAVYRRTGAPSGGVDERRLP